MTELKNVQIILKAVAGSRAHGLATETSDEDIHGVFSAPSRDFWGLDRIPETLDGHEPDFSYHELKKFLGLAIEGNPTVIELLFMESYLEKEERWGDELITIAPYLLNPEALRGSYLGYAESQVKRMLERNEFGTPKAQKLLKHAFRLTDQGYDLFTEGSLIIKATPERRDFYLTLSERHTLEEVLEAFQLRVDALKDASPSSYFKTDRSTVVDWLMRYRLAHA